MGNYKLKDDIGEVVLTTAQQSFIRKNFESAYSYEDWDLLQEVENFVEELLGRKPTGNWVVVDM